MVKILQVIGFKNSGKTTVTNQLIKYLKEKGLNVAVIKHHGDKSGEEIDIPMKRDHITYIENGADESIIAGYDYIHKLKRKKDDALHDMIEQITIDNGIILVEGYKTEGYDKIVLYKSEEDFEKLREYPYVRLTMNTVEPYEEKLYQFIEEWLKDDETI